jgi:hypothetical protein
MNQRRWGYGMGLLGSDVLACGGWIGTALSSCEMYTLGNNTWNTFPTLLAKSYELVMLNLGQCFCRGKSSPEPR